MEIKLKRLARANWAGVTKYDDTYDKLSPLMDSNGMPKTNIDKATARRLEKGLRMPEGELDPRSPYWDSFFIPVGGDEEITLRPDEDPEDELKYLVLKNHKLVADGYENQRKNSYVRFVLYNDEGHAKNENKGRESRKDAFMRYGKMSTSEMVDALLVLGVKVKNVNPEIIENQLGEIVDSNPRKFLDIVGDEQYADKLFIYKLLNRGILRKGRGDYSTSLFYQGQDVIGEGIEKVIEYLSRASNQPIRIGLMQELKASIEKSTIEGTLAEAVPVEAVIENIAAPVTKEKATRKAKPRTIASAKGEGGVKTVEKEGASSPDFDKLEGEL